MSERVIGRVLKDYDRQSFIWPPNTPATRSATATTPLPSLRSSSRSAAWSISTSTCCTMCTRSPSRRIPIPAGESSTIFWSRRRTAASVTWASPPTAAWAAGELPVPLRQGHGILSDPAELSGLDHAGRQGQSASCCAGTASPSGSWEPVRGGRLASLTPEAESELHALRPEESTAAWAFRFLLQGGGGGPDDPQRHDHPRPDGGQRPYL